MRKVNHKDVKVVGYLDSSNSFSRGSFLPDVKIVEYEIDLSSYSSIYLIAKNWMHTKYSIFRANTSGQRSYVEGRADQTAHIFFGIYNGE